LDRERRLSDTDGGTYKIGGRGSRGNTFNGQRKGGDREHNGWRSTAETPIHKKKNILKKKKLPNMLKLHRNAISLNTH
jgi:hypothetical protein